jgi:hypothetical protein
MDLVTTAKPILSLMPFPEYLVKQSLPFWKSKVYVCLSLVSLNAASQIYNLFPFRDHKYYSAEYILELRINLL